MTDVGHETVKAPSAYAFDSPYSPAVRWGDLLLISGQVSVDRDGALVGRDDIEAQTHQVFANIGALLAESDCTFQHLLLVRYYLTDMDEWPVVGRVRRDYLRRPYPAGTAVQVGRLVRPEWRLEIEAVARRG